MMAVLPIASILPNERPLPIKDVHLALEVIFALWTICYKFIYLVKTIPIMILCLHRVKILPTLGN